MIWTTPDLCDELRGHIRAIPGAWRSYGGHERFFGQVMTVQCHEDNSRIKELLNSPGEGRVLVVDGKGSLRRALLGDQIAAAAVRNGWSGVVINGAVRDVTALRTLDLGILALGSCPMPTDRLGLGHIAIDLTIDRVIISSGSWLFADVDGVVVSDKLPTAPTPRELHPNALGAVG